MGVVVTKVGIPSFVVTNRCSFYIDFRIQFRSRGTWWLLCLELGASYHGPSRHVDVGVTSPGLFN